MKCCLILLSSLIMLISCSKSDNLVKPKSTAIKGDMGEYLEIADQGYKIVRSTNDTVVAEIFTVIKVKKATKLIPILKLTALDKDGTPIPLANEYSAVENKDLIEGLKKGNGEFRVKFICIGKNKPQDLEDNLKKANSIEITSSAEELILTIEETFTEFQKAIKNGDKEKVVEFFDFPFEVDVKDYSITIDKVQNYIPLKGNYSKAKFLENYKSLFDKNVTKCIGKWNATEYAKDFSQRKNAKIAKYSIDFFVNQDYNGEMKTYTYEIIFAFLENKYKIYLINIGYDK